MTNRCAAVAVTLSALVSFTGCDKKPESASAAPSASRTQAMNRPDPIRPAPASDNSAANRGDGDAGVKTPIDQSQSNEGVKVTAEIRRAIMDDAGMSMNAQNCKITTDTSGVVTLRGPVASQAEKDSIAAKAKAVAGVTRVDNQLEIKAN